MPIAPIALFGDLGFQELLLVAVVSVMIFGKRLPEVAGQAFAQFQKLRRTLTQMWRETGIDEEMRRIRRDIDRKTRETHLPPPPRRPPSSTVSRGPRDEGTTEAPETFVRPDSGPAAETERTQPPQPPPATLEAPPDRVEAPVEPDSEPEASSSAASSGHDEARREP